MPQARDCVLTGIDQAPSLFLAQNGDGQHLGGGVGQAPSRLFSRCSYEMIFD